MPMLLIPTKYNVSNSGFGAWKFLYQCDISLLLNAFTVGFIIPKWTILDLIVLALLACEGRQTSREALHSALYGFS